MSPPLQGVHAIVTGGGHGIGAAIARKLGEAGANLSLIGRGLPALQETAESLGEVPSTCISADISDSESVKRAGDTARTAFGPVTVLINNAGIALSAPLHKTTNEIWNSLLQVNLSGAFYCMREFLPDMLGSGYGRIVNVASTAGLVGYPYVSGYCASKHGLIGLTRAVALETARRNITVNAVCPGYTDTAIVREAVSNIAKKTGREPAQALEELVSHNPQRRLIEPAEVASIVLWLCLPGSRSITGQSIAIAGGEVT